MRKALVFLGILDDSDIEWMLRNGEKQRVPTGTVLIQQGRQSDFLYFVLDGQFLVSTHTAARVAVLNAGEVLGEISLVDSRPPTASVSAVVESRVGVVPRALLQQKLRQDVGFASRFYHSIAVFLADRLRTTTGQLGSGELELDEHIEDLDEMAPHVLDNISLAGLRFSEMQRRDWGA
jgi:CRP-like cAMP-binding protein